MFLTALALLVLLAGFSTVRAQNPDELVLSLSRDFGYSSGTGRIQGAFSMKASGPADLTRVIFLIDGQSIGEDREPPFKVSFNTGSFPLGKHTLSARGYTAGGQELLSNEQVREFVPASEAMVTIKNIVIPLFLVIGLVAVLSFAIPALLGRRSTSQLAPGAERSYAPLGGAICPKCSRPFAVHIYGLNMLVGKYDRCPYCGKWSLVRRASLAELRAAEAAELQGAPTPVPAADSEEQLRRELEDSRYEEDHR